MIIDRSDPSFKPLVGQLLDQICPVESDSGARTHFAPMGAFVKAPFFRSSPPKGRMWKAPESMVPLEAWRNRRRKDENKNCKENLP